MSRPSVVVLNTRPREQAAELSRLLRAADFIVVEAPAIASRPAWDAGEREQLRGEVAAGAFAWVVLPSANAGRGFEAELRAMGDRVVCGAATAAALGLPDATALARFSAAAALEFMRPLVKPGQRVFVPRAAEARNELLDGLRLLHVAMDAPVAYRTVAVEDAANRLRSGGIDVVVVCSPSAVDSVAPALDPVLRLVCLGETTAHAADSAGLRVDAVASTTSMAGLVEAIESLVAIDVEVHA